MLSFLKKLLFSLFILLFSFFIYKNNVKADSSNIMISNFFILVKNIMLPQGFVVPIKYSGCNKLLGDTLLKENINYEKRAGEIIDYFIEKNKGWLSADVNKNAILNNIITWSGFDGHSADLILYADLWSYYKKINLQDIFISGTGAINLKDGRVHAVEGLISKFDAAIAHGIKIFIFAEKQRLDVENYCQSCKNNGLASLIDPLLIYYVNNVNELELLLLEISQNKIKKQYYEQNNINYIKETLKVSNVFVGGVFVSIEVPIVAEYLKNKISYGSLTEDTEYREIIEDFLINNKDKPFQLIEIIKSLAKTYNVLMLMENSDSKKNIIDELLSKYIFCIDSYYKKYYESARKEQLVTLLDVLDK